LQSHRNQAAVIDGEHRGAGRLAPHASLSAAARRYPVAGR